MADDSSLVYGWCALCQRHTSFPHECITDKPVDEDEQTKETL